MDLGEYLPMFLAECREHLQELNLAIVAIEETPDDRERVDEIFRIAHSMKGMSATMGFAGMARLTHEMEDVFELLRQRRGGLERAAIDVLLECLDALEAAVDSIDAGAGERIDPEPLAVRLRSLARAPEPEPEAVAPPPAEEIEAHAGDRPVLRISVAFADDVLMPSVRAYQVLAALGEHGDLLSSDPAEGGVDGFSGHVVEAQLATEHEEEDVARAVREVEGVVSVSIAAPKHEPSPPVADAQPSKPPPKRSSNTVRVDAERLDQLMHYMGELVVHRTHLESLVAQTGTPGLSQAMQELTRSSQALQAMVMQVRMIEVEAVFLRFPRLVRDISTKLGKHVDLRLTGGETELDRTVVDALGDPMVHLVRNSLDHGLELPEARVAAGKPETGTLEISARHAGGNVVITVRDDGAGIDPVAVARKARERGLIGADEEIDMPRAIELLFAPGFSTAEQTSDISGRGVGMDAVRNAVRALGGEVVLQSVTDAGTTAQIRLPLTLAIMSALLVRANGLPFAVPLDRVERTLRLEDHAIRSAAGRKLLPLRDGVLQVRDAAMALSGAAGGGDNSHAVIVRAGEHRVALAVEGLIGQRELVTRPLPPEVDATCAVAGGAVLSNGEIALIVDCEALVGNGAPRRNT